MKRLLRALCGMFGEWRAYFMGGWVNASLSVSESGELVISCVGYWMHGSLIV